LEEISMVNLRQSAAARTFGYHVLACLIATCLVATAGQAQTEATGVLPLANLSVEGGARPPLQATADGFLVPATGKVTADVVAAPDAFLCRLTPGANPDVVQLSIGRVSSSRCDSLFSPERDEALTFEGKEVALTDTGKGFRVSAQGPLTVRVSKDFMKTQRGMKWYRPLDKSSFQRAPAGWCSWYIYWQGITEDEMIKNTDWLAKNLKQFGCEYVQIDDGWQGVGHGSGENRDWYVTEKTKFPHGMKWLASEIRARGFRPGIWLIPFADSDEQRFRANPERYIRRADGTSIAETPDPKTGKVAIEWTGRYIVDPTGPAGQKWFRDLFTMLCDDWGYDYVKIDGQGGSRSAPDRGRAQLVNPKMEPDEAYRAGLDAIKSIMGPDRFLLNCGGQYDSCGYCEGIRIGGDVGPSWSGMQPAISSTMSHLYKNHIAFWTDPDVVCVRPKGNAGSSLSFDQAQVWATLLGITGQLLMASDRMYDLPEQSVELYRRIFPVADIRPMELYPLKGRPRIFDLRISKPGVGDWDVVALFNWNETSTAQISFGPSDLGLPAGSYLAYDVWNKRLVGPFDTGLTMSLPPSSCKVISVRPFADHPQLVGTSRHLTQGADDLLAAKWDSTALTWSGRSLVVGGDPYEVRFSLPPGWTAQGEGVRTEGPVAVLTLNRDQNQEAAWSAKFARTNLAAAAPTVREAKVEGTGRQAHLTWQGENAFAYVVYRNGEALGRTAEQQLTDIVPGKGQTYRYEIAAVGWTGESARVSAGEFIAQPSPRGTAPDARLQDLKPQSSTQDWGRLTMGKSVESNPISIGGKVYEHGLGTHANSELRYKLDNRYQRFEAMVGVDDEKNGAGTVSFQVFADGAKVWDSGLMRGKQAAKQVSVPLDGVDELVLVVTDGGDDINSDHADWAQAQLIGNK
jgi:hypothetical protein